MLDKLYKNKVFRSTFISFVVIILILNLFSVQAYAGNSMTQEIKDILNNYYIEDVPTDILDKESPDEIINDLNDPYTQIMNLDEYNSIVNNTFYGIGVAIEMTQLGAKITSVMVNSPAMKAGLKEGDIIVAAGTNSYLNEFSVSDVLKILNGTEGALSELRILRENDEITISIKPDKVYYPTVYSKLLNNHIAYIQIMSFGVNTSDEFEYKMNLFDRKAVDSYIIDLRNNPGGYIFSAVEIASYFAKKDTVAIAKTKNGEKFQFKKTIGNFLINKPAIVLVNKYTASAAEVLAASAQDYGTAIIIGENTYGKGVAQSTFQLSDGSILKATTLKLFSPDGRDISNGGILPDIKFKDMDLSLAGELLVESEQRFVVNRRMSQLTIKNRNFYVNIDKLVNKNYWEAYRQILSQAVSINVSNYSTDQNSLIVTKNYPVLKYVTVPKTDYKIGERATFKLNAPNYNGFVQYRAMLWDDTTNKYKDLWNTRDRYYDKWSPRGNSVFTISFPVAHTGDYRIKIFVKRSGIPNSKTQLKGMNCDSYVYEIPFKCIP